MEEKGEAKEDIRRKRRQKETGKMDERKLGESHVEEEKRVKRAKIKKMREAKEVKDAIVMREKKENDNRKN